MEIIAVAERIDKAVFEWALIYANPDWLVVICDFIVQNRNLGLFGLALLGYLAYKDRKLALKVLVLMAIYIAVSDLAASQLKEAFGRLRPVSQMGIYFNPGSLSFPSAHAMNSMGVAIVLSAFFGGQRGKLLAFALVVGVARTTSHYHFPGDILGGWMMGYVLGRAFVEAVRRWTPWVFAGGKG